MGFGKLVRPPRHHPRASSRRTVLATFSLCAILYTTWYLLDSAFSALSPVHEHSHFPPASAPMTTEEHVHHHFDSAQLPPSKKRGGQQQQQQKPLKKGQTVYQTEHAYLRNGLLSVSPEGRHPIYDLIERAEGEWNAKLAKQSKSLDEAVEEYKRRYGRPPPKGFDRWWDYVEQNNILLPDEYDQIHRDLEPFWALRPEDMRKLESAYEGHVDSYTLGKLSKHEIGIVNMSMAEDRAQGFMGFANDMIETIQPVAEWIPSFRAVFSPHDTPDLSVSWEHMRAARRLVVQGKHFDLNDLPPTPHRGWLSGCSPKSPARTTPFDLDNPPAPQENKTFIYDHYAAMDPCQHPSLLHQHGQFVAHNLGPGPIVPLIPRFSYSTTRLHYDIRPATPFNWVEDITDSEWERKSDSRLLWRGANTGIYHSKDFRWRSNHRIRMVQHANDQTGTREVLVDGGRKGKVGVRTVSAKRLSNVMMDIEFAGSPLSCEEEVCEELLGMFDWEDRMDWHTAGDYKYVMDIDGNGWSSRFKRLITTKSLIFKASVYPEWFTDRIQPWVHYIPVQVDFSDLFDALSFFRGDVNGHGEHDGMARKIAYAGREWSRTMWRREDMTAYNFRLMLEYARLMSRDRAAMSYEEPEDDI